MMKVIFEEFSRLLKERLTQGVYTTEDSVRYTFFAALVQATKLAPHEIILEYPHPRISRAAVDTYIPATPTRYGMAFEFKYDRQIPSGKNAPRPQKAGSLFNDFFRLSQFDAIPSMERYFIYLTDDEMATYLRNRRNGLVDFFELPMGQSFVIDQSFITSKSDTFQKMIKGELHVTIQSAWREEMPAHHQLRIYTIASVTS